MTVGVRIPSWYHFIPAVSRLLLRTFVLPCSPFSRSPSPYLVAITSDSPPSWRRGHWMEGVYRGSVSSTNVSRVSNVCCSFPIVVVFGVCVVVVILCDVRFFVLLLWQCCRSWRPTWALRKREEKYLLALSTRTAGCYRLRNWDQYVE